MAEKPSPRLLILNQMAGPMTWELAEDLGKSLGCVALLTGHPDTLAKGSTDQLRMVPAAAYQRGSFFRRAFSWLQYLVQAFFWLWRFPRTTPLLLFSNPPMLVWLGWLMLLLRGQKYAVMVHDIYPDVLVRLRGVPEKHLLIRAWRFLNRKAYNHARVVMTLGEFMAKNLTRQFDPACTPAGKVEVVYPWVDTERIKPMPKEDNWFAQKYGQVGKLTVMYSGNMGLGHDIETMIEAARLLKDEIHIHFMFIGAGPKWKVVKDAIEQHDLTNVTLLGWQPEETLQYSLAAADINLVSLELGMESNAIPSKAIYSFAVGSLLIALASNNGELAHWIEEKECGSVVAPGNANDLVTEIIRMFEQHESRDIYTKRISKMATENFSRCCNRLKISTVLKSVIQISYHLN